MNPLAAIPSLVSRQLTSIRPSCVSVTPDSTCASSNITRARGTLISSSAYSLISTSFSVTAPSYLLG